MLATQTVHMKVVSCDLPVKLQRNAVFLCPTCDDYATYQVKNLLVSFGFVFQLIRRDPIADNDSVISPRLL